MDSFPRAGKANLTNAAATMHRSVTSGVAVVPTLQENASSRWFVHKGKRNDETRLLTVCFLSRIYVNPFARSSKYIINVRGRILLVDLNGGKPRGLIVEPVYEMRRAACETILITYTETLKKIITLKHIYFT